MGKDETLKNIKAGGGLPPIGENPNNSGVKKETRSSGSSEGLRVMTFSDEKESPNR